MHQDSSSDPRFTEQDVYLRYPRRTGFVRNRVLYSEFTGLQPHVHSFSTSLDAILGGYARHPN